MKELFLACALALRPMTFHPEVSVEYRLMQEYLTQIARLDSQVFLTRTKLPKKYFRRMPITYMGYSIYMARKLKGSA